VKKEAEHMVCLLQMSLYGLKKSPREWYKIFDEFILNKSFKRCNFDYCVYFKQLNGKQFIYLLIYVDDMLIACKEKTEINKLTLTLKTKFKMKDLGTTKRILRIDIERDRKKGTLTLSQSGYLKKGSGPISTPIPYHFKLSDVKGVL